MNIQWELWLAPIKCKLPLLNSRVKPFFKLSKQPLLLSISSCFDDNFNLDLSRSFYPFTFYLFKFIFLFMAFIHRKFNQQIEYMTMSRKIGFIMKYWRCQVQSWIIFWIHQGREMFCRFTSPGSSQLISEKLSSQSVNFLCCSDTLTESEFYFLFRHDSNPSLDPKVLKKPVANHFGTSICGHRASNVRRLL